LFFQPHPPCDVWLEGSEQHSSSGNQNEQQGLGHKLKKQFTTKKKSGHDFVKVHLANSGKLGTRVRIEIPMVMAIMTKSWVGDREVKCMLAFFSRPLLHIRAKGEEPRLRAFNFSDALA
jgi:hypothetical protein